MMKLSLPVTWALLLLVFVCSAGAATSTPAATLEPHRILLVVENSKEMQRRIDGMVLAINQELGSRLQGQIKAGDSVGLWAYNEILYDAVIPVQTWPANSPGQLVSRLNDRIATLPYEKEGQLSVVTPEILGLVRESDLITVLILSSGESSISGTPFDTEINEYYATWRAQQSRAKNPFVTLLRGHQGKIINYAVTAAPWPLEPPALPVRTNPPAQITATAPRTNKPPTVPPLIVVGPKRTPEPLPSATNRVTLTNAVPKGPDLGVATNTSVAKPETAKTSVSSNLPAPTTPVTPAPSTAVVSQISTTNPTPPRADPAKTEPVRAEPAVTSAPPGVAENLPERSPTSQDEPIDAQAAVPKKWRLTWALVIGAAFLMAGLGWVFMRPKKRRHSSLITESLDRDQRG